MGNVFVMRQKYLDREEELKEERLARGKA